MGSKAKREQEFVIRKGDYGHELHFYLSLMDGTVYEIPGSPTLTFQCYIDGGSSLTVEDSSNIEVIGDSADGHLKYTVQSDDFSSATAGVYWCRVKVNNITSFEAKLVLLDTYSDGG